MSLKAFHIFFIAASTLLAFGFGGWALYTGLSRSMESFVLMGVASVLVGGGLVYYGGTVLQKLRQM